MTAPDPPTDSKRQILDHLKRVDGAVVADLANAQGITTSAVRQHLDALESNGLVRRSQQEFSGGRGRPATRWTLTALAADLFPDRHGDLTVELIGAIREAVGEEGLENIISQRTARQRATYLAAVRKDPEHTDPTDLSARVHRLAAQRAAEGYLAEVTVNGDGTFDLVEHHCPICDAAAICSGFCRDELSVFQDVLGDEVTVERTAHLLSGDARCSYRVTPVVLPAPVPRGRRAS
ncbi:MAG: helix-turn-helix transcriptional regulator [Acidimicrobiales bacterium]